ncbi:MAG: response regulator, partial [Candidatus Omnitrophota bacterium]
LTYFMHTDLKKTLRVLIVENSEVDSRMLLGMLSRGPYGTFEVETCDSLKTARAFLSTEKFDVVLLDLNLNDSNGIETLESVHKEFPEIAIVVNTGAFQDDLGLKSVTMGAQDYLIKGMYKAYGLVKALYYAIERKKAELDLERALANLQETQGQLIRAEKMNIIGSIASGVAHEVKNPLATILYGVEYLDTALKERDKKIDLTLNSMREATHKANNIVKDLLDFASLSDIKKRNCRIEEVIESALNLTHHQCEKNNIIVIKEFTRDVPSIYIDPNRVEQVIVDVVLNAILSMKKEGTLTIKIYTKKFSLGDVDSPSSLEDIIPPGTDVVIADFDDTGHGVRREDLPKVFDPFFTTRRARGGVGLGLSIARTIMTNHNGLIGLSNLSQKGARARLIFRI